MITIAAYFMGRDLTHADELTEEIIANAKVTVERTNDLLSRANRSDVNEVRSGWRPQGINDVTRNAAAGSRHLSGQAVDLADVDRTLSGWVFDNLDDLRELGLWAEDPRWCPTWLHLQTVPPKSGKIVFIPSSAPMKDPDFPVTWLV